MKEMTLCVPCLFGLEGLAGDELRRMDMQDVRVENGRVYFRGTWEDVARVNLCLRTGERVLILLGRFEAASFAQLFEGVRALPLEQYIPRDGQFPVKGYCLNSQLHSVPDCQSIVKKAAAARLGAQYGLQWLPESGEKYQLQFSIMHDFAELYLDTTGPGLHKRGYRAVGNDAPLRETLAAAMVMLARYRGKGAFLDPFCGSGTIAIEAALLALNRAPGLQRSFAAQQWPTIPADVWQQARQAACDREFRGEYRIYASDNDPRCVNLAISNAKKAGVAPYIRFSDADATTLRLPDGPGALVTNPPYGERMLEQRAAQQLYRRLGRHLHGTQDWKQYIITSEPEFELYYGEKADKKRKLYNGMIKCNLYMYL